jgi:hypothetical protein
MDVGIKRSNGGADCTPAERSREWCNYWSTGVDGRDRRDHGEALLCEVQIRPEPVTPVLMSSSLNLSFSCVTARHR